jgi:hypothetical protein
MAFVFPEGLADASGRYEVWTAHLHFDSFYCDRGICASGFCRLEYRIFFDDKGALRDKFYVVWASIVDSKADGRAD